MTTTTAKRRSKKSSKKSTERKRVLGVPTRAPKGDAGVREKPTPAQRAKDAERVMACPTCGAPPEAGCTGAGATAASGTMHPKRWRAYERALNAAAEVDPNTALREDCPTCGARRGKACAGAGGGQSHPHEARRVLAVTAPAPTTRTKRTGAAKITHKLHQTATRAAPCPICMADAGAPCVSTDLRGVARGGSHSERIDRLLANACATCGAEPGKFCHAVHEPEVPLYQATRGREVEHAARATGGTPRTPADGAKPASPVSPARGRGGRGHVPPTKSERIGASALTDRQRELLRHVRVEANVAVYTSTERIPDWDALKRVMVALGGKWRARKGFVFAADVDAQELVRLAIETGEILDPRAADFFETPSPLADRVVALADIRPGDRVLEPSAGRGALALAVRRACPEAHVLCVEPLPAHRAALEAEGFELIGEDFLELDEPAPFLAHAPEPFDAIVANPPFSKRADIEHVEHMLRFLRPGGALVAIMSAGAEHREDRKAAALRKRIEELGGHFERNPDGAFLESGTAVRTVTLVIPRKAEQRARPRDARATVDEAVEKTWATKCPECDAAPGTPCVGPGGAEYDSFATMHARRRALNDEQLAALGVEPPHALGADQTDVACPTCGVRARAACVPVASSEGKRRPLPTGHVHTARQQAQLRARRAPEPVASAPELAQHCRECGAFPGKPCVRSGVDDRKEREAPAPGTFHRPRELDAQHAARAAKTAENAALPERSVPCPTCKAKVGAPCVRPSGHKTFGGEVHAPRRKAAEEASRAAASASTPSTVEPLEPALRVECPSCLALPGQPCMRGKGKRKSPSPVPHEARTFAELGLDRRCSDCGAGPYEHCKTDDGERLIDSSKGKLVTHAARRTLPLPEVADRDIKPDNASPAKPARAAKRRRREEPPPNACYECGHVECPIHPDCSGCKMCADERAANGTDEKLASAVDRSPELGRGAVEIIEVACSKLRTDGGTQPRGAIDEPTVARYAADYTDGATLPPGRAVYDGENYWLWDGFHRLAARKRNGSRSMFIEVRQGTQRDAILLSLGANAEHGLRRSDGDVKRAILRALADEEWSKKALRWIAKHCRCHHSYVERVKREHLGQVSTVDTSGEAARVEGQDGKSYPATQPSRPSRPPATATSTRTTVEYDGDVGPEEPAYEHEPRESGEASPDVARDASASSTSDASHGAVERVEARAETPRIEGGEPSRSADEHVDLAQGGKSAPPKPRKWRDVLELPSGPIDPMMIIERHSRLTSMVIGLSDEERAEIDRAKSLGLSQWETMPDLADRMVELAGVAKMDRPSVLESSAGTGQLVEAIRRGCGRDAHITAHEIDPVRVERLRKGAADVVHEGDFLAHALPSRRYDATIDNTPYEGGLDGRFLERLMECSWRIVALCRLNVLTGKDRCERVWSRVKSGEWHLTDQVLLEQRPEFVGPGDDSARSDYVVVQLVHATLSKCSKTRVDWW